MPLQENIDEGRNVVHYQEDHSGEAPEQSPPPPSSKPMLLVRGDGVVFPSNCMYP